MRLPSRLYFPLHRVRCLPNPQPRSPVQIVSVHISGLMSCLEKEERIVQWHGCQGILTLGDSTQASDVGTPH